MTDPPAQHPSIRAEQVPSLGILEDALSREDDSYRDRANGIDTKAGVVLSAAGVVVALVGLHARLAGLIAQLTAILAGVASVATILPRVDKAIGPRNLRDRYLQVDEIVTRMFVANTRILLHERNERRLFDKALRFKIAAVLLLLSAAAIGVGGIVDYVRN